MKGRDTFTTEESIEIKKRLDEMIILGRYSTTDLRIGLRSTYQFYISDFSRTKKAFRSEEFDLLVEKGLIKIVDK